MKKSMRTARPHAPRLLQRFPAKKQQQVSDLCFFYIGEFEFFMRESFGSPFQSGDGNIRSIPDIGILSEHHESAEKHHKKRSHSRNGEKNGRLGFFLAHGCIGGSHCRRRICNRRRHRSRLIMFFQGKFMRLLSSRSRTACRSQLDCG